MFVSDDLQHTHFISHNSKTSKKKMVKTAQVLETFFEWSIGRPPFETANQGRTNSNSQPKRGSIQKARKSPDLERIYSREKAFTRGMKQFADQKGPRTCQRCSFASFLIFRGFSLSLQQGLPNSKVLIILFLVFLEFGKGSVCCPLLKTVCIERLRWTSRTPFEKNLSWGKTDRHQRVCPFCLRQPLDC